MSNKIKNIELLRIIGCISVILYHLFEKARLGGMFTDIDLYKKLYAMTSNGYLAVELFFILSGFFLAWKLNLTKTCWEFIKSKLIRLYPSMLFATILYFITSLISSLDFKLYPTLLALIGLNGTNLVLSIGPFNIGIFWFVSALLWTSFLLYYLRKNFQIKSVNLLLVLLIFFSYGLCIHFESGRMDKVAKVYFHVLNVGMLRAIAGMSIGYFIGEWFKANFDKIKNWLPNKAQVILLTFTEFITLYFIINNLMLHKLSFKNQIVFIVAFSFIILLFLSKKGVISKFLEKINWHCFSKYTYSLFLTHPIIIEYLRFTLWKNNSEWVYANPIENIIYTLLGVLILGIFTYHFVEKPSATYLYNKFGKK